jgi:hypothetical protein
MAKTIKEIEVIAGETNPNILLIAPHGVMGNDDNVGKLARAIQKKLGATPSSTRYSKNQKRTKMTITVKPIQRNILPT